MGLLRLIALGILAYALYKLLSGKRGESHVGEKSNKVRSSPKSISVHDTLMEDPICHTYVPKKQALILEHKGKTSYFCSEKCRQAYRAGKKEGE